MSRAYTFIDRNIYLIRGKFKVAVVRRPKTLGGWFGSLKEAIKERDAIEAATKKKRNGPIPGGYRRDMQALRAERRAAGMCLRCGDEAPVPGLVTCRSCLDTHNLKRRIKLYGR